MVGVPWMLLRNSLHLLILKKQRALLLELDDNYVALFVRMLGLDHDPLDRDQAIVALWKYSLGGKKYIDAIMQFPGCINLVVNLLRSESSSTCEAAAGLLRSLSSINLYRDSVADSGAVEEITRLLSRPTLTPEVKEQSMSTLWNLSVDEKIRVKIANSDILPLVIKYLDDEEVKVKEAAGGVLANLVLSHVNHEIMVEAGVIPKLAKFLKSDEDGSKIMRKEARNALLELAKDEYYRIIVIEEGLIPVPIIGTAAYKTFRPEMEDKSLSQSEYSPDQRLTLLPWMDGVARLVLMLELEDESAILRAARSIADASINEHMRIAFKEAGAIKYLVQLLNNNVDAVRFAVTRALERLSVSNSVCHIIEAEGAIDPLIDILNCSQISDKIVEKSLNILDRMLDPSKEMKLKFYSGPVNGSEKALNARKNHDVSKGINITEQSISDVNARKIILDPAFIARLVEILKSSSPKMQRKAASLLEFVAATDPSMVSIISVDIESSLVAVLQQKALKDMESDIEAWQPEKYILEIEEAGLAISAASRLLREILKSDIPLHNKDWVAACLFKLSSLSGHNLNFENPINIEVTIYETIPRLIEQIRTSFSLEAQEAAVVELNRVISEGMIDSTRALASEGVIVRLVKLIEEGSERAAEASLAILYNLSMDSENHSAIVAAGAVASVKENRFVTKATMGTSTPFAEKFTYMISSSRTSRIMELSLDLVGDWRLRWLCRGRVGSEALMVKGEG
ncbi:RING-type E3 ubiquitin transferase [Quillaja saponaria]|uniref:RING-type E3 ubiquitin transferase n=1 Tax=Quillaja saponaria TaxID=32244 RepID=A0AAD7L9T5_QUISA|nr:RING-type E3 ubiquitin transferase [Quillaja saponaria]